MTYTLECDVTGIVEDAIGDALNELEEAAENIRKYRPTTMVHQEEIDLDYLLAEHHAIAIVWDCQHVRDQRSDLTSEQAWAVLQLCQERWDRLNDPMLQTIRDAATALYPPARMLQMQKISDLIAGYGGGNERENLVDLLADAMHWCEGFGEPFEEFAATAQVHFAEERSRKGDAS